eukprot:678463_1
MPPSCWFIQAIHLFVYILCTTVCFIDFYRICAVQSYEWCYFICMERTEREHKRQKHKRGNSARILNEKVYSRCYEHLNDVISTPNMGDSDAISSPNGYESSRGYSR